MAVTVTYSFQLLKSFEFTTGSVVRDVDVVGLANGGFAVAGENNSSFSSVEIYNGDLALAGSVGAISLGDPAIAQLTNGNLAIAQVNGFQQGVLVIVDQAGNPVVNGQVFADFDEANVVDIAALTGGGFVVVHAGFVSGSGPFVAAKIFNNAGTELLDIPVSEPPNLSDPVVAALDDGGFALAFVQDGATTNSVVLAVYNANGSMRSALRTVDFDSDAPESFSNLAITAMDGGFALAYEDATVSANTDIRLTLFNSNGDQLDTGTLTGPATIDKTPSLARMPGGLLAVSLGYSAVGPADSDTFLGLYDPVTETFLAQRVATMGNPLTDDTDDAVIASFGAGRLAAFHTNRTDNDVDGEALEVVRTSTGDAGGDLFDQSVYRDVQNGGGGSDFLDGGGNNDTLNGEAGDDNMLGGAGNDTLIGGSGTDTALYTGTAAVTVNLALTTAQNTGGAGIDTLSGIENLIGSNGGDTLTGNGSANRFDGGLGGDTLRGGLGNDMYAAGVGDTIVELAGQGYDTVETFIASFSLAANVERVNYLGFGNFVGTGNNLANRFQSGGGDDRFIDILGGADIFSGGNGTDTVDFRASATGVNLNFVTNSHSGAAAGDSYSGIEKFLGSNTAADTMTMGGTGRALFVGGGGADRLNGGVKNDQLIGQAGNDILKGNGDRDSLDGGTGNDTMTGGAAGDVFVFIDAAFGQDTITDYQDGLDSFKINSAVADSLGDFTITGNGTASVRLTLVGATANFITVKGAGPITISGDDFVFY